MKMLNVAEGILDSAAEEWLDVNAKNSESVMQYGEGYGVYLTRFEALKVLICCKIWLHGLERGDFFGSSNDYYYEVERPLGEFLI